MMYGRGMPSLCVLAFALAGPANAAELAALQPGCYDVTVSLELPHLEDLNMSKVTRIVLTADEGDNNHGLAVLSDNNPLSRCPISNIHQDGVDALTFDIVCEGKNQAKASARYVFAPGLFRGRITMQMGGKNMTMTEVQVGHRVDECAAGGTRSAIR